MNSKRNQTGTPWGWVCALVLCLASVSAWAGLTTPLYLGNLVPVLDQYGEPMMGAYDSDPSERARVEIRTSTDGIVRPPSVDGTAHPYNPLLAPDSISGIGANAYGAGLFAEVLTDRPAAGTKIFARAFNAPTVTGATFYADTAIGEVLTFDSSLVLTFSSAQPLDGADMDFDGLNNSWERVMGTDDRLTPDYDGDGMTDLHEMLAGTVATDIHSLLAFQLIEPAEAPVPAAEGEGSPTVLVRWQSVPGKQYQLEWILTLLGQQTFLPIGDVVTGPAGETEMETLVVLPLEASTGTFRIRLVPD